jgi:hypothetical protein
MTNALAVFAVFGIAASIYSARHLIAAVRSGIIRQDGRVLSFQAAPLRFLGSTIHIVFGLLAGILCIAFVAVLLIRAV